MMGEPKLSSWERKHRANVSGYQRQIDRLYNEVLKEAARIGATLSIEGDGLFSFADHPQLRERVERLFAGMNSQMYGVIVNGIEAEWTLANNKNSELARRVFGDNVGKLSQAQYRRYFSTNDAAREAFINRREAGLKLSDRVWRYTNQFKEEIELGLDVGIRNGMSAADMTRELRQWLREPDRLFRRVRDEHGELQLSKAAAAYHPGRGVYRSSYKNARRLAATETNIAYRTSDYHRWQQLDFVVGIRVVLSNNHPDPDICDELSAPLGFEEDDTRGRYPKDFKFTGWHPHCRCHVLSILKTDEEIEADTQKLLDGKDIDGESVNKVDDVPQAFKDWLKENEERLQRASSLPYFMTDNPQYTGVVPRMAGANGFTGTKLGRTATKEAYETYAESKPPILTKEQQEDILLLAKELEIKGEVKPMNFREADSGAPNPKFKMFSPTGENCQTCVAVFEARLRGLNITAKPYLESNELQVALGENTAKVWRRTDGKQVSVQKVFGKDDGQIIARLKKQLNSVGRYHVGVEFTNEKLNGHIFTAEVFKGGRILFYDPQRNEFLNIGELVGIKHMEFLKVDKLLFNHSYLRAISTVVD